MRGFDSKKYVALQSAEILKRIDGFKRLYLEFGGKLIYDEHASRVLPGYKKTNKVAILKKLGKVDFIYCVNAKDIESKKTLGLKKLTYVEKVKQDLKDIKNKIADVEFVVITRFDGEPRAKEFADELRDAGKKVYFNYEIKNYFTDMNKVLAGYRKNEFVPVKANVVVVTGPASGSGKMGLAMSQVYHEARHGKNVGYAKFETFPIWNLPLNNPINIAYEAATADLGDKNMIDKKHLKAYGVKAVNYNRDIENFEILMTIARKITKQKFPFGYHSPTDMGVNMAKFGIVNLEVCEKASIKEIKSRYKRYLYEFKKGREEKSTVDRMKKILKKVGLTTI